MVSPPPPNISQVFVADAIGEGDLQSIESHMYLTNFIRYELLVISKDQWRTATVLADILLVVIFDKHRYLLIAHSRF